MSCDPLEPCGTPAASLVPEPPSHDVAHRSYRLGHHQAFIDDAARRVEQMVTADGLLGSRWDVGGDPSAERLLQLWADVAEGVAAYTELTANEACLGTARDWDDLARIGRLVGYRVRPGGAASGWVRFDLDRGASPVVPAGTRVKAPALPPDRTASQIFEVVEKTQLRSDWAGLTATRVPTPGLPPERVIRFLGDPGLAVGDLVLLVEEDVATVPAPVAGSWSQFWAWMVALYWFVAPSSRPLAVARVTELTSELGTTVVTFDRDLASLLGGSGASHAAYRITQSATSARRLASVVDVSGTSPSAVPLDGLYSAQPVTTTSIVLDRALADASAGQKVAVIDWAANPPRCWITDVTAVQAVDWNAAPGSPTPATKLTLASPIFPSTPLTVHFLDARRPARHYTFPSTGATSRLRLYPRPAVPPDRLAVKTGSGANAAYEVVAVTPSADQEQGGDTGLLVDVVGTGLAGTFGASTPASANLARVRHGETKTEVLGSGDATVADQTFALGSSPLAFDVDASGAPRSSLTVRVDELRWEEVPSLYAVEEPDRYRVDLDVDGGASVTFGDGRSGARLPTGTGNVTATYRQGGGVAGEVPSGAIDSLVGSVRGVQRVAGAGPTTGGADHDDATDLRRLIPTRARALGRAVSLGDLRDLALGFPGVSHAVAFSGAGPAGCCAAGLHVAFLRRGSTGPRAPLGPEIKALRAFLDARRDTELSLCVCAGSVRRLLLKVVVVRDPRRSATRVEELVRAALLADDGPLDARRRELEQPLDRSDVAAVVHGAPGVVGLTELTLDATPIIGPAASIGRIVPARAELLLLDEQPEIEVVTE